MATYYFRNTGDVNWGTSTNWSLTDGGAATGAVPTAADDAYFTSNSGNCTVNTSNRVCKTLIFSGVGAGNYSGTFTFSFIVSVSGSVTLSSTMTLAGSASLYLVGVNTFTVLTSNGKQFDRPLATNINGTGSGNISFADNWRVTNFTTNFIGGNPISLAAGAGICEVTGDFATNQATSGGVTKFKITGAGTISAARDCSVDMTIDCGANTITITNMSVTTGIITYVSGTINHTGTITVVNGAILILNLQNQQFNNYAQNNGANVTLTSDANFNNITLGVAASGTTCVINGVGYRLKCRGNAAFNQSSGGVTGTAIVSCIGSGNISAVTTTNLGTDFEINTSGTYTFTSNTSFGAASKTFTYTAGTVNTSTFTTTFSNGVTLNTNGINWYNVTIPTGTITINSLLTITNNLTVASTGGSVTFNGTAGWTCANLLCSVAGRTIILQEALTYTTTTSVNMLGTNASRIVMTSSSGTNRAIWTLNSGATQSMVYVNGTRIDSSLGQTIWTFGGTLTSTINWNLGSKPGTVAYVFAN